MDIYKLLIRDLLFGLDPEFVHDLSVELIKVNPFKFCDIELRKTVDGLVYKNPIGLGAGFDKGGKLINSIGKLGFGFMEVGTITPKPQLGNPKPRLFRDIRNKSIINRMGFNNPGLEDIKRKLDKRNGNIIIGGNIGKGFDTSLEDSWKDYLECFRGLRDRVDFIVINLSSPNTPNLRNLMKKEYLVKIINSIQADNFGLLKIIMPVS